MIKKTIAALVVAALMSVGALAQQPPPPNFLNLVAIGDSITLGVRIGGLNQQDQIEAYPALFARQVGTFLFLPLLLGPTIELVEPGLPPVTQTTPASGVGRVFPLIVPQNLAIGGHNVRDALLTRPDLPLDSAIDLILGLPLLLLNPPIPVSQIELAVGLQPTFTLMWLGANDVLGAATQTNPDLITPLPEFQALYQQAVGAIITLTPSQIVVANVPDVTTLAFFLTAEEVAQLVGAPLNFIGPALGIEQGDLVTLLGLELIAPILQDPSQGPLPDSVVFTAAEVAVTRTAVAQMNGFISAFAAQAGFPVVDINSFLIDADQNGLQVGDFTVTTDYLGGLFSLDGVHPTATAQALIANEFINTINAFWGISIPLVDAAAVAVGDDLVLKPSDAGTQALTLGALEGATFEAARKAIKIIRPDPRPRRARPASGVRSRP
ncbi:MAG: SGNH/GDSL hydrolase family protein [Acidobacteriota bacterium]